MKLAGSILLVLGFILIAASIVICFRSDCKRIFIELRKANQIKIGNEPGYGIKKENHNRDTYSKRHGATAGVKKEFMPAMRMEAKDDTALLVGVELAAATEPLIKFGAIKEQSQTQPLMVAKDDDTELLTSDSTGDTEPLLSIKEKEQIWF